MTNYDKEIEQLAINPHDFSPIMIVGNSGSGKSTFLERFCKRRRELYYPAFSEWKSGEYLKIFNARDIFESIIESISKANPKEWREQFTPYDVVVIDDFDIMACRHTTQEELFSYFLVCNKAIMVTTNKEITEPVFSSELVSFFSNGVIVHLDDPDKEAKTAFLINQLTISGIVLEQDALLWLSEQNFKSYAAIKGFIKTLRLFHKDSLYTLDDCKTLAKSYIF